MDPNAATSSDKDTKLLPTFSGKKGTYEDWKLCLIALSREKGFQEALQLIPETHNGAKTLAYAKADNILYNTILTSVTGEARLFVTQKFPVKEDTPADAYLGHKLYQAMKSKFSPGLTPQEVFNMKKKILDAKCDKNISSALQYIQTHRFNYRQQNKCG